MRIREYGHFRVRVAIQSTSNGSTPKDGSQDLKTTMVQGTLVLEWKLTWFFWWVNPGRSLGKEAGIVHSIFFGMRVARFLTIIGRRSGVSGCICFPPDRLLIESGSFRRQATETRSEWLNTRLWWRYNRKASVEDVFTVSGSSKDGPISIRSTREWPWSNERMGHKPSKCRNGVVNLKRCVLDWTIWDSATIAPLVGTPLVALPEETAKLHPCCI